MGDPTRGVPWAISGRFAHPKPFCGLTWAKTVIWPYLGLCGSILRALCPGTSPLLFVVSTTQNGPNTPLDPSVGSRLSRETRHGAYHGPFPAFGSHFAYPRPHFGLIVHQNRNLAVSWVALLKSQFRGHFPPTFCSFDPQKGPKAPLELS